MYISLVITVMFNQSAYSVNEDDEMLQIVLVLSNSSVTNVTIKLIDNTTTATGKHEVIVEIDVLTYLYI